MTEFLAFARRGKTAWWRYLLATVLALVVGMVLASVALLILSVTRWLGPDLLGALSKPADTRGFYGASGVIFGTLTLAFVIFARLIQGKRFSDITGEWRWRWLALAAAAWLVIGIIGAAVDYLLAPSGFRITASSASVTLALWAIPGLALQTFAEEFVFRGYFTQGLLLLLRRPAWTALVSGVMFGALHIPNGWPQAAGATVFGVATALIAIRTGGIAFTYGMHLVNNIFGAVVLVSGGDVFRGSPALFSQDTPHLDWWDFGLEAIALAPMLWLAWRIAPRASETPSAQRSGADV